MWNKTMRRLLLPFSVLCLLLTVAGVGAAKGGYGLLVEVPEPASDGAPLTTDSPVLIVNPVGCGGLGASVSGKAIGVVDGRRVTIPLGFEPLGDNRHAIRRQWPQATPGTGWVIVINAKSRPFLINGKKPVRSGNSDGYNSIIELGADGKPTNLRQVVRWGREKRPAFVAPVFFKPDKPGAIEAALKRVSAPESEKLVSAPAPGSAR